MKMEVRISVLALAGFAAAHAGFSNQGLLSANGMSVQGLSSFNGMNVQGLNSFNGVESHGLSKMDGDPSKSAGAAAEASRAAYAALSAGQPREAINTVVRLEGIILADDVE
jgi:hypothetical protein